MRAIVFSLFVACLMSLAPAQAQNLPNPRDAKSLPSAPENGSKWGEWTGGPKTALTVREGVLSVVSSGSAPSFYSSALPPMRGPFFIEFRANSNLMGPLEISWTTKDAPHFSSQNKVIVGEAKAFDGKYRHYLVELPQNVISPLQSLRIDPGTGAGESLFQFIRIRSMTGKIYKEWKVSP